MSVKITDRISDPELDWAMQSSLKVKNMGEEEKTAFKFLAGLAEKVESLEREARGRASSKPHCWFYWWIKLLKRLNSTQKSCSRLLAVHKYLSAAGYLVNRADRLSVNSPVSDEACVDAEAALAISENARLKERYDGMDLSAVASARAYYRRTAAQKCLKFLEAAVRLLKRLVPEFVSSFGGSSVEKGAEEETVQKKFRLSVRVLYEDAVSSFEEELAGDSEDGSIVERLRENNLVDRFLEVLSALPDPAEPANRFVGGRIFGKLEKIPYNPGGSSRLDWGVMTQKKKEAPSKCASPLASFLTNDFSTDGRFRYAFSDGGIHKMEGEPSCAPELEKEKREAVAYRIEHPLRDKRTANNLVSFCVKFAVEVDAVLGHPSVRSDVGAKEESMEKPCGSPCVESWEAAFGRCVELGESIFLLMNDAYGLPYVAALHAETEMRSAAKSLWSTFQEYVESREIGKVKQESLDADDPDGTVQMESAEAPPPPVPAEAEPAPEVPAEPVPEEATAPVGAEMMKARFNTRRLLSTLEGRSSPETAEEDEEIESLASNEPPDASSYQDKVALALARYVSACKIMTKKFLSSCFRPGAFGLRFKPGYDPGTDNETKPEKFRKNAIRSFSKPLKRFQEQIEPHCAKVERYFGTAEGNQQKPTFKECMVGVWSIRVMTKTFKLSVRWLFVLCYVAWCGTPRSYCFYGTKRYLEKCKPSACYYYGKIGPDHGKRDACHRSRTRADPSSSKGDLSSGPSCCATGSQGSREPLAALFSDELPRLDRCLFGASKAMEKLMVRCKEGVFHDLLAESVLASKPFSRFSDYASSGILLDEDDVPESPGAGIELSKGEAVAAREVVAAAKIWLSAKRDTDFLTKKHLELCFGIYVAVVRFYLVYLGEAGFGNGALLQKRAGKKLKVDVYDFSFDKGYERSVPFVPPSKVSVEGVGHLRANNPESFKSLLISRNNACALFEADSENELLAKKMMHDLLGYESKVTRTLWLSVEAERAWVRFLASFGYDSAATDSRYAPWVNGTYKAEEGRFEGRRVLDLLHASFGKMAAERGLTWREGSHVVTSKLTVSDAIQLEFLAGSLEAARDSLRECSDSMTSKFLGSDSALGVSVSVRETPTPEPAAEEVREEVAQPATEEKAPEAPEAALVGADFWTNHHGINRGFNSAWKRGKKEGYAEGFKDGKESGLAVGRDELEDTKHLADGEFLRRFEAYEGDYGDVLVHLYLPLEGVPAVAESESYDSNALKLSRDLMTYHQHLGDSKAFISAFNDDGTEEHNRRFYREIMWKNYRRSRYAKYWSQFDRCFEAWGKLYPLNEVVQMKVSESVFQERLINGDPELVRLSGERFFNLEKYPHPSNMLYSGMLYRKLLDKTPLMYGDRAFALGIMSKDYRAAIKNIYKNFSKAPYGKGFRRYVSRSIKLYDWVSTNLGPVLYRILVEIQERRPSSSEGLASSSDTSLPAFKTVPEKEPDVQTEQSNPVVSSSSEEEETPKTVVQEGGEEIATESQRVGEVEKQEGDLQRKEEEKEPEEEEEEKEKKEAARNISINIGGSFATTRTHTFRGEGEKLTTITATTTDPEVAEQLKRGALESDVRRQEVMRTAAGNDARPIPKGSEPDPGARLDEEDMYDAYEASEPQAKFEEPNLAPAGREGFEDANADSTATGGNIYEKFIDDLTKLKKARKLIPFTGFMFGPPLNLFEGAGGHSAEFVNSRTSISRDFVDEFMTALAVVEFECSAASRKIKGKDKKGKKATAEKRLLKRDLKLRRYYDSEAIEIGAKKIGGKLILSDETKEANELGDPEPKFSSKVTEDVDLGMHHLSKECDGSSFVTDAFISYLKDLEAAENRENYPESATSTPEATTTTTETATSTEPATEPSGEYAETPSQASEIANIGPKLWKRLLPKSKSKVLMALAMSLSAALVAETNEIVGRKSRATSSKQTPCATNPGGRDCSLQTVDDKRLSLALHAGLSRAIQKDAQKNEDSWVAGFLRDHVVVLVLDPTADGKVNLEFGNVFVLRAEAIPVLLGEEGTGKTLPRGLSSAVVLNARAVRWNENPRPYDGDVRSQVVDPKGPLTPAPSSMRLLAAEDALNPVGRTLVFAETLGSSKIPSHALAKQGSLMTVYYSLDEFAPVDLYKDFAAEGISADRAAPLVKLAPGMPVGSPGAKEVKKSAVLLDLSRRDGMGRPQLVTFTHPGRPVKRGRLQLMGTVGGKSAKIGEIEYVAILMAPRAPVLPSPFNKANKK